MRLDALIPMAVLEVLRKTLLDFTSRMLGAVGDLLTMEPSRQRS